MCVCACVHARLGIRVEVREAQVLVLVFHLVKNRVSPRYIQTLAGCSLLGILVFVCHLPIGTLVILLNLGFP